MGSGALLRCTTPMRYSDALLRRTKRVRGARSRESSMVARLLMAALWPYQATSSDVVSRSTIRRVASRAPASLRWQSS